MDYSKPEVQILGNAHELITQLAAKTLIPFEGLKDRHSSAPDYDLDE